MRSAAREGVGSYNRQCQNGQFAVAIVNYKTPLLTAEANAGLVKMLPEVLKQVRTLLGERRVTVVFDRGVSVSDSSNKSWPLDLTS